jgi:antitoxin component of MazEF toxin-antitoxin module
MGYISTAQVIQRHNGNCQYYMICPAQLAQALEIQKGETIEWIVEDKYTLTLKRQNKTLKSKVQKVRK